MCVFWSLYSFQGLGAHRKKYIYRDKPVPAVIVTFYETYVSWNNEKKYKSTLQIKSLYFVMQKNQLLWIKILSNSWAPAFVVTFDETFNSRNNEKEVAK